MKSTQPTTSNKPAKEELRAEAYELYVKKGMSIDTIFRILPEGAVSRKTLFNWKDEGNWDSAKRAYFNRAKDFEESIWTIAEKYADEAKQNPDPQLAYALSSLVNAVSTVQRIIVAKKSEVTEEEGTTKKENTISAETIAKIQELLGAR